MLYELGKTYGMLTVIAEAGKLNKKRRVKVRCSCANSTEKVVNFGDLRSGKTKSCGCMRLAILASSNISHGMRKHPLYQTWGNMLQRCTNTANKDYHHYGGRGITVCARWKTFENFLADVGKTWEKGLTLDRKDNELGYNPENCKWSSREEQARNRRNSVNVTLHGKTQCLNAWCIELGISYQTVNSRIKLGYTLEQALQQKS